MDELQIDEFIMLAVYGEALRLACKDDKQEGVRLLKEAATNLELDIDWESILEEGLVE